MSFVTTVRHYLRTGFSRELPQFVAQKIRNTRRRRQLGTIRRLPPLSLRSSTPENVSVHLLTSHYEWREALWAIRSLLVQLGRPLPVVVHDDGTLRAAEVRIMQTVFPGLTVLARDEADRLADRALALFPACRRTRMELVLGLKLFDPWLAGTGDVILIDSDVLWFAPPVALEEWLAGPRDRNRWNEDVATSYCVDPDEVRRHCNLSLHPRINSGVGFIARASMDLEALEDFLTIKRNTTNPWLIEQTAYAYLSSRHGVELLPKTYAVDTPHGQPAVSSLTAKHYVGHIRHDFYLEGIPHLARLWQT